MNKAPGWYRGKQKEAYYHDENFPATPGKGFKSLKRKLSPQISQDYSGSSVKCCFNASQSNLSYDLVKQAVFQTLKNKRGEKKKNNILTH